jgi:diacylglycerol kinase (ATP)
MRTFFKGFIYAFQGIYQMIRKERNARFHFLVFLLLVPLCLIYPLKEWELLLIILCVALVFAAEAFNSSIERLANVAHPDRHPLIGEAKDMAAGAVLILAIASASIGLIIFFPHFKVSLGL